jgi:hypothetical protein
MHERGTISQVPQLRFGLGLVAFTLPLALQGSDDDVSKEDNVLG